MNETEHYSPPTQVCRPEDAARIHYDAVIVGSGVSGSILAQELTGAGRRVLIVEAGPGHDLSQHGFERSLLRFYGALSKDNNAPFANNPNADMPRSPLVGPLPPDGVLTKGGYLVQYGPFVTDTVFARALGGTTLHWEAKAIRMLREDFQTRTKYGVGLDWPLSLDDLMPYYERAEYELGVSGDVEAQKRVGVEYRGDYVYPMTELRASYLDQVVARRAGGMSKEVEGEQIPIEWITFPQAKNADPNPAYVKWNKWGKKPLFEPQGAISMHQDQEGERCQGNTNCVPLCPVQARYDARKTLKNALWTGRADLLTRAVASRVFFDAQTNAVTEIEVKVYEDMESPRHSTIRVHGKLFFLAANAIENARLMLASAELNRRPVNDMIGRHLMDHAYLLSWALLPEDAGVGRGPSCTSGMCNFRRGKFREKFAAFAADIHNDGWGWATGAPVDDLRDLVNNTNLFGRALREELIRRISRQLLLAYMIEVPPDRNNRVTVDPRYTDALGNMRPAVRLNLSDYTMASVEFSRRLSTEIFQKIGAFEPLASTLGDPTKAGYLRYNGESYNIHGGNHLAGTHLMGTCRANSAVDADQKSWDHPNLYMVGPGSLPTIGSSNTTLTTAALCLKTSEAAIKYLNQLDHATTH